ncbi:MAG TPA: hypothetical protein VGX70_02085 [Gemmataceae bacterium]|jgi:hypothetical protein|nr:hypothetical protein [Gemmataceae bacterium]
MVNFLGFLHVGVKFILPFLRILVAEPLKELHGALDRVLEPFLQFLFLPVRAARRLTLSLFACFWSD